MIRVSVELVTHETGSAGKRLYTVHIVNDKTGTPEKGNYLAYLYDDAGTVLETVQVTDYPRKLPAWQLAALAFLGLWRRGDGI